MTHSSSVRIYDKSTVLLLLRHDIDVYHHICDKLKYDREVLKIVLGSVLGHGIIYKVPDKYIDAELVLESYKEYANSWLFDMIHLDVKTNEFYRTLIAQNPNITSDPLAMRDIVENSDDEDVLKYCIDANYYLYAHIPNPRKNRTLLFYSAHSEYRHYLHHRELRLSLPFHAEKLVIFENAEYGQFGGIPRGKRKIEAPQEVYEIASITKNLEYFGKYQVILPIADIIEYVKFRPDNIKYLHSSLLMKHPEILCAGIRAMRHKPYKIELYPLPLSLLESRAVILAFSNIDNYTPIMHVADLHITWA